jgi:Ni,Fe-hydrogenase maturation factor
MGYAEKELNSTGKIYKILKNEFKRREKSAKSLHQLKQEQTEKVSIFAGRIRKYVRGIGVKDHKELYQNLTKNYQPNLNLSILTFILTV